LKGVPQFSPQATSTELDDKGSFPLFGRLIPGDDGTAMPLLRLLVHEFGVSHFAVIHQNDAYGSKYATSIRAATRLYPNTTFVAIDLPGTGATNEDYERAVAILKGTKFRYFFAIVSSTMFEPLMNEAFRQGIAGTGKHNWIFSDSIGVGAVAREYDRGSPLHLASLGASRLSAIGGFDGVSRIYDNYLEAFKSLSQGIVRRLSSFDRFSFFLLKTEAQLTCRCIVQNKGDPSVDAASVSGNDNGAYFLVAEVDLGFDRV
jgi:Receptor family ligand binding region